MTFDTLKYAETLRDSGIDEKQASAQAHALNDAITDNLATKQQLDHVEAVLSSELIMIKWMMGGVGFGVFLLVVKTFLV